MWIIRETKGNNIGIYVRETTPKEKYIMNTKRFKKTGVIVLILNNDKIKNLKLFWLYGRVVFIWYIFQKWFDA